MSFTSRLVLALSLFGCGDANEEPSVDELPDSGFDEGCSAQRASTCNPLTQTGCSAMEKCTSVTSDHVYIGCAANGTVAIGESCSEVASGAYSYDDCVAGAICSDGICKQICDLAGGAPACGDDFGCHPVAPLFTCGISAVAGVCDPQCDPLTQDDACGSPDPTHPTRGCYGLSSFVCEDVIALPSLTDRIPGLAPRLPTLFNECAPGFVAFFVEDTGSTVLLCTGLCAALEVDNTSAHAGNALGDPSAIGKLPTSVTAVGDATCAPGKKGSEASSTCRFLYPYLVDDTTGELPDRFASYRDTLGVCLATDHYTYDPNGGTTPTTPFPRCETLPPRSSSTPGRFDDAADWGCQLYAHSLPVTRPPRLFRVAPPPTPGDLARHPLR